LEVLKSGRIVRLPSGAQFKPTGKKVEGGWHGDLVV